MMFALLDQIKTLLLYILIFLNGNFYYRPTMASDEFDCEFVESRRISRFNESNDNNKFWLDPIEAAEKKRQKSILEDLTCFDSTMPSQIAVLEGATATIPCFMKNVDLNQTKISWWKENSDREISFGNQVFQSRFELDIRGPNKQWLLLENAQISDSGKYFCQINSVQLKEKFVELSVHRSSIQSLSLNDGVDVELVKSDAETKNHAFTDGRYASKNIEILGNPIGHLGSSITLTCVAKFPDSLKPLSDTSRSNSVESVQWIAPNDIPLVFRRRPKYIPVSLSRNTTVKWVNNTVYSYLTISKLTNEHSGRWECRRYWKSDASVPTLEDSAYVYISLIPLEKKAGLMGTLIPNSSKRNICTSLLFIFIYNLSIISISFCK